MLRRLNEEEIDEEWDAYIDNFVLHHQLELVKGTRNIGLGGRLVEYHVPYSFLDLCQAQGYIYKIYQ